MRNVCREICKLSLMISRVLLFEILLLCLLKFSCATSLEEEWRAHCQDCSFELHLQHACLLLHWNSQLLLLLVRWRWPVSFFLSFSLLLLLRLPVFCFFFWWGQFVWQQKKQKGSSIDKRGGKKNCASEYPPWGKRQKSASFFLHTPT